MKKILITIILLSIILSCNLYEPITTSWTVSGTASFSAVPILLFFDFPLSHFLTPHPT